MADAPERPTQRIPQSFSPFRSHSMIASPISAVFAPMNIPRFDGKRQNGGSWSLIHPPPPFGPSFPVPAAFGDLVQRIHGVLPGE